MERNIVQRRSAKLSVCSCSCMFLYSRANATDATLVICQFIMHEHQITNGAQTLLRWEELERQQRGPHRAVQAPGGLRLELARAGIGVRLDLWVFAAIASDGIKPFSGPGPGSLAFR